MKFSNHHRGYFNADKGAFSVITERENFDSQLTFTDVEAEIILDFFSEGNIHRGRVSDNPKLSKKAFKLFNGGTTVFLNVNFPKDEGSEIRLYLSKRAGFKPTAGDIWFLYIKDSELWIGSMPKPKWDKLGLSKGSGRNDESDYLYQEEIHTNDEEKIVNLKFRDVFKRDRRLALLRMQESNFTCEVDYEHDLFISRFSGFPYLEAHHLVPLGASEIFDSSLDILNNIFCLCPNCHRAIHHAEGGHAKQLIDRLINKSSVLDKFSLEKEDLYYLYSI
ncbi:MAG: HNH endonuclease [Candidatus Paceibacterota bacterium]